MLALFGQLVIVAVFAWLARVVVGARGLGPPWVAVATIAGMVVGDFVALQVLISPQELEQLGVAAFRWRSLPLQIVATLIAMLLLELAVGQGRGVRLPRRFRPWEAVGLRVRMVLRTWQVTRIAVRQGIAVVVGLRPGRTDAQSPVEVARRARLALEDAGGMFVKLGQLLATRADLMPPAAVAELGRLHAQAAPLPRREIEQALRADLGDRVDSAFDHIEGDPLGSASIAQVHGARLRTGEDVVIKVRRPGLVHQVEVDVAIVRRLARLAEQRTAWGAFYGASDLAEEFTASLRDELDFRVEARHATESDAPHLAGADVRVPRVHEDLSTDGVLVMDRLAGVPLASLTQPLDPDEGRRLADELCTSQVAAMLEGHRFHGDPHPGNVVLLDDGRLGLIDFGVTGRLDAIERSAVLQMLVALHLRQPSLLYESMVTMGAVRPTRDPEDIERALAQFMDTYLSPDRPQAEAITELLRLTTDLGLSLPRSSTVMFRALATLTGTLEHLRPGYPLLEVVADVGGGQLRDQFAPTSLRDVFQHEGAQLAPLIRRAPRHVDRIATLLQHGELTTRMRLFAFPQERRFIETMVNRVLLVVLALGMTVTSVLLLQLDPTSVPRGAAPISQAFGWAGLFVSVMLLARALLAVLRRPQGAPHRHRDHG